MSIQPGQVLSSFTGVTLNSGTSVILDGLTTTSGYRFLYNGSQFGLSEYRVRKDYPEMNIWNGDGTVAFNFFLDNPYILDVAYDKTDDVYYAIRWNVDDSRSVGGYTFSDFDEGGTGNTATSLLSDFFTSSSGSWRTFRVPSLPYTYRLSGSPWNPGRDRVSTSWLDYNTRYYTGYSTVFTGSSWGSSITETASSYSEAALSVNTNTEKLVYYTNASEGILNFDVGFNGSVLALVDVDVSFLDSDSIVGLRVLGGVGDSDDAFNELASIFYRGPSSSPTVQTWTITYSDSTGDAWKVHNLRLDAVALDSAVTSTKSIVAGGSELFRAYVKDYRVNTSNSFGATTEHVMDIDVVDSTGTSFGEGILGADYSLASVDYSDGSAAAYGESRRVFSWKGSTGDLFGFDLHVGYDFDPISGEYTDYVDPSVLGSSLDFEVAMTSSAVGVSNDKLRLAIMRQGSVITLLKRDNSVAGGGYSTVDSFDSGYTGAVKFEIFTDSREATTPPEIDIDQFVVRDLLSSEKTASYVTPSASWPHPVLTLESYDLDGKLSSVSSVTNSSGVAIGNLDIIKAGMYTGGMFENYLGNVQIATNHASGSAGEFYINVGDDIYKYLKSALPITAVETGGLASIVASGTMYGSPYSNTLMWNSYSQAGLAFVAKNDADPGSGLYINTLKTTTGLPSTPPVFCWVESKDSTYTLFAADVNSPDSLYALSTSDMKVYVYNLSETNTAFCNVVSAKQIMGANTSETSVVVAQVLNVYGEPLSGKTVNFDVSAGDGSVSPVSGTTDASGEASTTYTVGATVGPATVRAVVVD